MLTEKELGGFGKLRCKVYDCPKRQIISFVDLNKNSEVHFHFAIWYAVFLVAIDRHKDKRVSFRLTINIGFQGL